MQNHIQRLAAGIIDYDLPVAALSIEALDLELVEGEIYSGSFSIESSNGISVNGRVISSNSRIHIRTASFTGEKAEIFYEISAEALREGDCFSGDIYVLCQHAEFRLPVNVRISRQYFETGTGIINNINSFLELAKESYDEALGIFMSDNFTNLFHEDDIRYQMYYEALTLGGPVCGEVFDEFLCACGIMPHLKLELMSEGNIHQHVREDIRERFLLQKTGAGTFRIEITTDSDFIELERSTYSQEDFIGNQCEIFYFVRNELLHAGINLGRIFVNTDDNIYEYHVTACKGEYRDIESRVPIAADREMRQLKCELARLYIDYRMNRNVTGTWASESILRLDKLLYLDANNIWYKLFKALILLINEQRTDAKWLIDESRRGIEEENASIRAFWLYVSALERGEQAYLGKCLEEVRSIYHENSEDNAVLWAMLFMDEEFERNKSRKLNAIKNNILGGKASVFIYFEGYYIISQDSYLMGELGPFEIRLIKWAIRHDGMTHGIAAQFARLSSSVKFFSEDIFRMLCYVCEKYPEKDIVTALCSYLIRCCKRGNEYERWYKLGLDMDIRLAGMYENYLYSVSEINNTTIPKELILYFQYSSQISDDLRAALMALVILNKSHEENIYISFLPHIDSFAIDQLSQHNISSDLKIIYEDFFDRNGITSITAEDFCEIVFTRNIIIDDDTLEGRLIIRQSQLQDEQSVVLTGGRAIARIYSPDFVVIYEDGGGRRRALDIDFTTEPLFIDYKYRGTLLDYAPSNINILLHYFANKQTYPIYDEPAFERIYNVLASDIVRDSYKKTLVPELLRESFDYSEEFFAKFYKTLDLSILSPQEIGRVIEECVRQSMMDTAFELIKVYGYINVIPSKLVVLCDNIIGQRGFDICDEQLCELCYYTFSENLYTESTLLYLAQFYDGATVNLESIWQAAVGFNIKAFELEERILKQALITDAALKGCDDIFASYVSAGGSYMLRHAYYSYKAIGSIIKGQTAADSVFDRIKEEYLSGDELMEICQLALLKWIIDKPEHDMDDMKIEENLLGYFINSGRAFSFFENADRVFKGKYLIQDRMYMEFIGRPEDQPYIHYKFSDSQGEYETMPMRHMMCGIFVTEIILFCGESVQFYVTLGEGLDEEVLTNGTKKRNDVCLEGGNSRFEMLNNMYISSILSNRTAADKYLKEYIELDALTTDGFKIV